MHIINPVEEEGNYSRCSRETLLMAYDLAGNSIQLDITLGENSGEISDTCVSLVRPRIRLRGHPVNGLSLLKNKNTKFLTTNEDDRLFFIQFLAKERNPCRL